MTKGSKLNKTQQYYIDMSREHILEVIKGDQTDIDVLEHKKTNKIISSLEGNLYRRDIEDKKYGLGGIELIVLTKLDFFAEYLTAVTLPFDDPEFEIVEGSINLRVNKVILGTGYDLCDIQSIDILGIKVTKDLVRQIGKHDRIDTLQTLLDTKRIKSNWGNIVLEWSNKVETLEWANTNLNCITDADDSSLGEAYDTALLDCNLDKISWLLSHNFEFSRFSSTSFKDAVKNGRLDIFECIKQYNGLSDLQLSDLMTLAFENNQFHMYNWFVENIVTDDIDSDISTAICSAYSNSYNNLSFNNIGFDRNSAHYFASLPTEVLTFCVTRNIKLDKDATYIAFLNSCEYDNIDNINMLNQKYLNNEKIKLEGIDIASKYSSINVLNMLLSSGEQIDLNKSILNASVSGKVEILEYMFTNHNSQFMNVMQQTKFDDLVKSCKFKNQRDNILNESTKHVAVLQWYHSKNLFTTDISVISHFFESAFQCGDTETMDWLFVKFNVDYVKIFNNKYYHLHINSRTIQDEKNSFLKSLDWLKSKNFVFLRQFKEHLVNSTHINIFSKTNEVLEWLKANILTSDDVTHLITQYTGQHNYQAEKLKWFLKNYPEHTDIITERLNIKTQYENGSKINITDVDNSAELSTKSEKKSKGFIQNCIQS
jgi:hypothetical protein